MNSNGFVTSALLYGVLSLFLILVLGTVSIIGNRKLSNDKIKQSALDDVQNLTTEDNCFELSLNTRDNYTITGYNVNNNNNNCYSTVFIPETIDGIKVDEIGYQAFFNKELKNVTIKSNVSFVNSHSFDGNVGVLFIIKGNMPKTINDDSENVIGIWGATRSTIRQD